MSQGGTMSKRGILIAFVFLVATIAMSIYSAIKNYQQLSFIRKLPVAAIDLSVINDGDYKGSFCYSHFCYKVNVSISSHAISAVTILRNRNSDYGKKAAAISERIIKAQSLQVDMISGATITSKSIVKSVEKALTEPEN
jgi:uncharacterized protein with FMN-binding domain